MSTHMIDEILEEIVGLPITEAKSKVNPEALKTFLTYIKKKKIKINKTALGAYLYIMEKDLSKTNKELFDKSSGSWAQFKQEYSEKYGKNWEASTFKKAVKTVYGPDFFKEWSFLNSKASVKKRYPNPKHFKYVGDGLDIDLT